MLGLRFSEIHWGATLILALMRICAASIVVFILVAMVEPGGARFDVFLATPVVVGGSILAAVGCVALDKMGIPFIGIGAIVGFLAVVGDPLLWIANKFRPGIVPMQDFGIFNRTVLLVSKV